MVDDLFLVAATLYSCSFTEYNIEASTLELVKLLKRFLPPQPGPQGIAAFVQHRMRPSLVVSLVLLRVWSGLSMAPPIPPQPVGTLKYGVASPRLVIECFHDLCCPFSGKMFRTLSEIDLEKAYPGVDLLFQNVPQPWHAQSSYMHEVSLAVKAVDPSSFFPAVGALFDAQARFFDDQVMDKTRNQIYAECVDVVCAAAPVDREAVLAKLRLAGEGNAGNGVTLAMKWAIKYHRVRSVHVTPTVFLNGVEAPDISSGWTVDQWKAKLDALVGTA